jgi:RHS repeat-associated protein
MPLANANGWNNTDVTVMFTCNGGVAPIQCPAAQTVTTEGANQTITGTAKDTSGATAVASVKVSIDKTAPTITAAVTPLPNAKGWNNSNVTVTFTCADVASGIDVCPSPVTVSSEGAGQVITGAATDRAGNSASTSVTINVDKSLPSIKALPAPSPNAAGWNNSNVTVTFACTDPISGIAVCSAPVTVSTEGANQVVSGVATNAAGNTASASVTVNLDKTPPTLSITSPTNGAALTASPVSVAGTVADALSGVPAVTCNGAPASVQSGAFSCSLTLNPGANTITAQANDVAGNTTTQSESVTFASGPAITGFSPSSGSIGTLVTVTGSGFATSGASPVVTLNQQGGGTVSSPVSSANATSLSFVIPAGAATGPLVVAVGTQSGTSASVLTVTTSSSFTLGVAPGTGALIQGQSTTFAVSINSANGFSGLGTLAVTGVPSGVTASFKPNAITAGQTSVLTLSAPANQATSTSTLSVSATATIDGQPVTQSAAASLQVTAVTTSFLGRTVVDDSQQTPIVGVAVKFLGKDDKGNITGCSGQTTSDTAGNFSLTNLPAACTGPQLISYDGSTASSPAGKFAGVNLSYTLASGQVTTSPVLVHLPRIDNAEMVQVQQNASTDQVFTFQTIPGLVVTVYAGTRFSLDDGSQPTPFPLIAIEVPVDRLPDIMPTSGMLTPFIVAFQPANAVSSQPVSVNFPNPLNVPPGQTATFMTLDPTRGYMVPYGTGIVSSDGTKFIADPDPAHPGHGYGLIHFDWHGPTAAPPSGANPGPSSNCPPGATCFCPTVAGPPVAGKPVDLSSGIEVYSATDIEVSGPRGSISIVRTYRTLSGNAGPFGIGTNHNYGYQLNTFGFISNLGVIQLIMPDGNQFPFYVQQNGTLINTTIPSLRGAVMTSLSSGVYNLRWKDGTTYQFQSPSAGGRVAYLTSITDSNGNIIAITLNSSVPGQVTQVADPVGRSLTLNYDSLNRISSIVDPIGRTVQYSYNSQGTLATVTDPTGGVTSYAYNPQNSQQLISVTDPRGVVIAQNTYDSNGRVVQQVEADGGVFRFAYTLLNSIVAASPVLFTVVTDPMGNQTTYRFDPLQLLSDVTDPSGQMRIFTKDLSSNNLITAITGPATCSSCGTSSPGDQHFTLDANGNVLTQTDALRNTTTVTYEPSFNKISSITDPLGNVTKFTYDTQGNMLSRTDANANTTLFAYNSFGQVIQITDPLGQKTIFSYDASGNLISSTDPLGNSNSTVYDAVSRPVQTADALGRKSTTAYDALDRVTAQTNAQGSSTQFAYDGVGNLLLLTDAKGNKTSLSYDGLNRLLTKTDALGKTDTRTYSKNGSLVQFVDRRGQTSSFGYDTLNRLLSESYQDARVTRSYDAYGRLVNATDSAGGAFDFSYDLDGRLLSSASQFGTVQYTYDAASQVTSRQVVGQSALSNSYDPVGNLLSATLPQAAMNFAYDARDQLTSLNRANTVNSQYAYDNANRLLSIAHSGGQGINIPLSYAYDATGNRTTARTTVAQPLITQAVSNTLDAGNRLLTSTSTGGATSYTYDTNGNLITASSSSGTTTYIWDSRNRLQSISAPGQTTTFLYDFAGNLIQQVNSGNLNLLKNFVLDGLTNVAYVTQSNGDNLSILAGPSIDRHYAAVHLSGQVEYGLTDAINTTVATVDQTGKLASQFFYEPYGQTTSTSGYPFQFTGRVPASASLYYYRSRYYDSTLGRFISEDPIGFQGGDANLYRYALGAPDAFVDPSGLTVSCTYVQSTGHLTCTNNANGQTVVNANGYSGGNQGRNPSAINNPACQAVPFVGPIPQVPGGYVIGPGYNNPGHGGLTLPLTPQGPVPGNRNGLFIHGGNGVNQNQSQGCIVIAPGARQTINNLGGGTLTVVP